ncbi:MAG TPA: hypothetical protein VH186_20615 [Chloroflexia bacterium]|nr:hypothetical protein [Chloroflexia bacterium]
MANIDGVELRMAMLFLWVSVFCFFGFVVSLSFPGLAFADVACLLFFLITLVEGLNWLRKAVLAAGRKQASGAVKYREKRVSVVREEETAAPAYSQEELEEAQDVSDFFYSFFHLGEVGESLWVGRG